MANQISILMYHQIGAFKPMQGHRSTYCHYQRFAAQMHYLYQFRYTVMSLETALLAIQGKIQIPKRAVVLTFDDGYENFYEYAFPILEKYNFPAIVYLLSGYIGKKADWFAAENRDTPAMMHIKHIKELQKQGIDFGSHGIKHKKLAQIELSEMQQEVQQSKQSLEDMLGKAVDHFCYPYGSFNAQTIEAVQQAGYRSAMSCIRASAKVNGDIYQLPRKAISYGDSLIGYIWKIHLKNKSK